MKLLASVPEFGLGLIVYEIVAGWCYASIERPDLAAEYLRQYDRDADGSTIYYLIENVSRIKCMMAEHRDMDAWEVLNSQSFVEQMDRYLLAKLDRLVFHAVLLFRMKDREGALLTLKEAYDLSSVEGFDMPYIEMGKDMRSLVSYAIKTEMPGVPVEWLQKIHKKSSAFAKQVAFMAQYFAEDEGLASKKSALTEKEISLLTDLSKGLSRNEISATRDLSINTVKLYINTIYAKLGANSLADAIQKAYHHHIL
jgi:LuxR family maltose regulon positive regulatory protein